MSNTTFKVDKASLQVSMSRVYKASPERLFEAYTDPKQIPLFWGPAKYSTRVDKLDLKVGGVWRFVQKGPDGKEFAFNGVYKIVDRPKTLSYTFEFEPQPGHVMVETATFVDQGDGTTLLEAVAKYSNLADLEEMSQSGMESGAVETCERLAALIE